MYLTLSGGIQNIHNIEKFLNAQIIKYSKYIKNFNNFKGVIAWGNKRIKESELLAQKLGLKLLRIEDGFLKSLLPGEENIGISLILDDKGIYYDTSKESKLEFLINNLDVYLKEQNINKEDLLKKAQKAIEFKNLHELSKYNHFTESFILKSEEKTKKILLIDQVKDDLSVQYSGASLHSFELMLEDALNLNNAEIYIKLHPSRKKDEFNYLEGLLYKNPLIQSKNIKIIKEAINPISLIKKMDEVYVVSSQLGFEACLLKKKVKCYAKSFYAGWGFTEDIQDFSRQTKKSIEEVFVSSYMLYSKYINPCTGEETDIFYALEFLKENKRINIRNSGKIFCFGFSFWSSQFWKRHRMRKFLFSTANEIYFPSNVEQAKRLGINSKSKIFVWGIRDEKIKYLKELAYNLKIKISRIEDGFIRSVGLGTDFIFPYSLVLDQTGIYYDATTSNDLEILLNYYEFDEELIQRTIELKEKIIKNKINKYNVQVQENFNEKIFAKAENKKRIVVVGQVPKDASIKKSCEFPINSNYRLLKKVREDNPSAFIIFKIHPDLVSRNRSRDNIPKESFLKYADYIDFKSNSIDLIERVDEIHTMSSLTGFEALIRNKKVITYRRPFYSGWGLTHDKLNISNRKRKLSLNQLLAVCLILYPTYYNLDINSFCLAEDIINLIIEKRKEKIPKRSNFEAYLNRRFIQFKNILQEIDNIFRGFKN